jgi:hypothetical protein
LYKALNIVFLENILLTVLFIDIRFLLIKLLWSSRIKMGLLNEKSLKSLWYELN